MFSEVVAGVDFAPGQDGVIALARRLTAPGGRLTLAHVVPSDPRVFGGGNGAAMAGECDLSRRLLERERLLMALDERQGGRPEVRVEVCSLPAASPARGLSFLARRRGVDLLVVGAARRGLVNRVLIGDGARAVLLQAPCAVAIASAGDTADAGARPIGDEPDPIVIEATDSRWMSRRQAGQYARLARDARRAVLVLRSGSGSQSAPAGGAGATWSGGGSSAAAGSAPGANSALS